MTDELVGFLRARLDEDAQVAQACGGGEPWPDNPYETKTPELIHARRHDPARVLADVEAKRQVIELHGAVHRSIGWLDHGDELHAELPVCGHCVPRNAHYPHREDVPEGPCATVRLLALSYVDHPGYDESWKP